MKQLSEAELNHYSVGVFPTLDAQLGTAIEAFATLRGCLHRM